MNEDKPLLLGPDEAGTVLTIQGDRIVHLQQSTTARRTMSGAVDCSNTRIHPGAVNAHTHLYSGLTPFDMPDPADRPQNFPQILERIWWRLDRALDAPALRASARYYVATALLAGTTTLIDHHESPNFIEGSLDVLADACQDLGMRAVLCYGATERNGGREEGKRGLAENARFHRQNKRLLVRGVVGLHASFTVSDETIREAGDLCRRLRTVLHVHVAEDAVDVRDARARSYFGPLERLHELDALPAGSLLAHGIHFDRDQVRKTRKYGLWLIQNPRSNLGNDVGYPRFLAENERVALGTDGYPSDMREEEAVLAQVGLSRGESSPEISRRAPAGRGLAGERFGARFAPLAAGTVADVVAAVRRGRPRHVVVGGRLVVRDGKLLTADFDEIRAEAEQEAGRVWQRMTKL